MIKLEAKTIESLLYVEPFYTLAEGTDALLTVELSPEWGNMAIEAVFERDGRVERVGLVGGSCRIPRAFVAPPSFCLMLEGGKLLRSACVDVYVQKTLRGGAE